MGLLMGYFLTHRVKRVRACSCVPQTRYPLGHLYQYDMWVIHSNIL
jgi:hypothetical protein